MSRVWIYANGFFRNAREDGLSYRASRARAAFYLRRAFTREEMEAALPRLKALGVCAYGITRRALRGRRCA